MLMTATDWWLAGNNLLLQKQKIIYFYSCPNDMLCRLYK